MAAEVKKEIQLEIAHVSFVDIVGYSKLSVNEQHAQVEELNQIVRFVRTISQSRSSQSPVKDPHRGRHGAGFLHQSGGTGAVRGGNQSRA